MIHLLNDIRPWEAVQWNCRLDVFSPWMEEGGGTKGIPIIIAPIPNLTVRDHVYDPPKETEVKIGDWVVRRPDGTFTAMETSKLRGRFPFQHPKIDWSEWTCWTPMPMPLDLKSEELVRVRLRNGNEHERRAGDVRWNVLNQPDDIIAYRRKIGI